jgi:hypothetical protein
MTLLDVSRDTDGEGLADDCDCDCDCGCDCDCEVLIELDAGVGPPEEARARTHEEDSTLTKSDLIDQCTDQSDGWMDQCGIGRCAGGCE